MIHDSVSKSRGTERHYFIKVLECVQFLGRQGVAFRGSTKEDDNLVQLLKMTGKHDTLFQGSLQSGSHKKYTHSDYQNEIITLMANEVLHMKLTTIHQAKYFAIMCDEWTDVSNKEHLSFCV